MHLPTGDTWPWMCVDLWMLRHYKFWPHGKDLVGDSGLSTAFQVLITQSRQSGPLGQLPSPWAGAGWKPAAGGNTNQPASGFGGCSHSLGQGVSKGQDSVALQNFLPTPMGPSGIQRDWMLTFCIFLTLEILEHSFHLQKVL